jgi:tetratricopeptide (TPR) repeat protein
VHEALADARHRSGDYAAAVQEYRAARRLTGDDRQAQARLMLKLAQVQGWLDRYSNALRWITRALRILDGAEDPEAQRQRAQLLSWYARFCQQQGHHERAISWCRRAIPQAELAGEKDALTNALGVLDWAQMDLGRLESPTNWRRAWTATPIGRGVRPHRPAPGRGRSRRHCSRRRRTALSSRHGAPSPAPARRAPAPRSTGPGSRRTCPGS